MIATSPRLPVPAIRPYFDVDDALLETIRAALESGQASNNGPHVQAFERALADYLDVKEAVAVSTGFEALLLAIQAFDLKPGVAILPAYTYIATLNAVVHAGLEPLFCDIDPATYTMDTQHLAASLSAHANVRCIIPVNVFGIPAEVETIRQLCDSVGAKLIYDNAHGFGSEIDGWRYAAEAHAQIFSLHATKTLPAVEGGLVLSSDPQILATVRRLRNHGLTPQLADCEPGYNAKLDEIRAIIGGRSLTKFPESLARRRQYGQRLYRAFEKFEDVYRVQEIPAGVSTNFQNLGVRCLPAARIGLKAVLELFRERGVGVRSYFDPPLYKLNGFGAGGELPETETLWQTLVSFPIHSRMSEETLEHMESVLTEVASILRSGI